MGYEIQVFHPEFAPLKQRISLSLNRKLARFIPGTNGQGYEALSEDIPGANTQVRESLNWGNETSCKSSIFKRAMWKNLLRCNQREVPILSDNVPKKLRQTKETGTDFLGRVFSANSCQSQFKSQPKTVMPPVSRCEPVCGPLADRVASVSLRKAETRCWEVFRPLLRGMILPLEVSMSSAESTGMPEN